jgi:hypothetical protein
MRYRMRDTHRVRDGMRYGMRDGFNEEKSPTWISAQLVREPMAREPIRGSGR